MLVKTTLKAPVTENDRYLGRLGKDIVEYSVFRRIMAVISHHPQLWKCMTAFCLDFSASKSMKGKALCDIKCHDLISGM